MATLEKILTDVQTGSVDIDVARNQIRTLFSAVLDEAAIGVSNVDATDLYEEMRKGIEST